MSLLETLLQSMTSTSSLNTMSKRTGGNNDQMAALITAALPILLKALTSNASTQSGAASLQEALGQHQETGSVAEQLEEADEVDGAKILQHILGGNSSSVMNGLSRQSGLSNDQVGSALGALAPVLLSSLSAASNQAPARQRKPAIDLSDGIDASDIMGFMQMMSSAQGGAQQRQPQNQASFDGSDLLGLLSMLQK
ncbi:MAG: DUF937 domain-containing protein [Acidaminococcaceae bacterium]|nr:DUF937 domain-containing protein [Acidaminococcaceae bacterium]MBQ9698482.1 DUF937 domain-containing protein [Acidaminococcaceae bacterium]